jgi:hypothetical protein
VSIKGSPYARFRRALELGDLALVHVTAAELPRIDLDDALSICVLMARTHDRSFERAAVRWTARLCLEHRAVGIAEARVALALFDTMPADPDGAEVALKRLRARLGSPVT